MKKNLFYFLILFLSGCINHTPLDWDFNTLSKPKENPIVKADSTLTFIDPIKNETVKWARADVFNPAAIVKDNKVYLFIRCEDNPSAALGGRTSRIGLATSDDGIHFTMHSTPVLYPDNSIFKEYDYPGGCEDPRVVQTEDSLYVMTYTSWNYKIARLSIAFSKDLIHWEKKGLAFGRANNGKFKDNWTKSASIITKMAGNRQVAAMIKGKY